MMNLVRRYIVIPAIKEGEKLIPIWDKELIYEKDEYGETLRLDFEKHSNLTNCIFDLKTKNLSMGIELDFKPTETNFKKGDAVYVETDSFRVLREDYIKDIVFENYEINAFKGSEVYGYLKEFFANFNFDHNTLYAIRIWKPTYILSDGTKVEWEHKLFHKFNKEKKKSSLIINPTYNE